MTQKQISRLEQQRARLAAKLGDEFATIAESDTAVMTTRMAEHDRSIARRYREVVRQLAGR